MHYMPGIAQLPGRGPIAASELDNPARARQPRYHLARRRGREIREPRSMNRR
jgi:hypothetical protein